MLANQMARSKAVLVMVFMILFVLAGCGGGSGSGNTGTEADAGLASDKDAESDAQMDHVEVDAVQETPIEADVADVTDASTDVETEATEDAATDGTANDVADTMVEQDAAEEMTVDANDAGTDVIADVTSDVITDAGTDVYVDATSDTAEDAVDEPDSSDAPADTMDAGSDAPTDVEIEQEASAPATFKCGTWVEQPELAAVTIGVLNGGSSNQTSLYNFKLCSFPGGNLYGIGNTAGGDGETPAAAEFFHHDNTLNHWDAANLSGWATHWNSIVCGTNGIVYFGGRQNLQDLGQDNAVFGEWNSATNTRYYDPSVPAGTMTVFFAGTPDDGTMLYVGTTAWSLENKYWKRTHVGANAVWTDIAWTLPANQGSRFFALNGQAMIGSNLLVYGSWYDGALNSSQPENPTIYRYDGSTWTEFFSISAMVKILSVSGTTLDDFYVTGGDVANNIVGHVVQKNIVTENDNHALTSLNPVLSVHPGTYVTGGPLYNLANGNIRVWTHDMDGTVVTGPIDSHAYAPDGFWKEPDTDVVHMVTAPANEMPRHYFAHCK